MARDSETYGRNQQFDDFRLTVEVHFLKGSNSGIYLRGVYEIQIAESFGKPLDSHTIWALLQPDHSLGCSRKARRRMADDGHYPGQPPRHCHPEWKNDHRQSTRPRMYRWGADQRRIGAGSDHAAGRSHRHRIPEPRPLPSQEMRFSRTFDDPAPPVRAVVLLFSGNSWSFRPGVAPSSSIVRKNLSFCSVPPSPAARPRQRQRPFFGRAVAAVYNQECGHDWCRRAARQ